MRSIQSKSPAILLIGGVLLISAWIGTAAVAGESRIELEDGSLITGKVLSGNGQTYRIRSRTLGIIEIDAGQVRSLKPSGSGGEEPENSAAPNVNEQRIDSIQKDIAADSGLLGSIMALEDDPTMREALADEEFMRAITNRDFETLRDHPTIRELLDNPRMRAIIDQIQRK